MTIAWPASETELIQAQERIAGRADAALAREPFTSADDDRVGGCFVAFARGEAGPGHPGDRAWTGAVVWRRAGDPEGSLDEEVVVFDRVPAAYAPGLLALREGPALEAATTALHRAPDVVLVDATGLDHPRRAGLALHLGAVIGLPTVGVTHRPLVAWGDPPPLTRGARTPLTHDEATVGYWLCTRSDARPIVAHAAWRTDPETAVEVVLAASTERSRTPVPLREARRAARTARAAAGC